MKQKYIFFAISSNLPKEIGDVEQGFLF